MEIKKKDVKKIKKATKEELGKLHEQYKEATKNVSGMSPIALIGISVVGIIMIFYFTNKFLILIGIILLLAPIYVFIKRGAHREGYFEGYYEMMKKLGSRDEHSEKNKSE